jgi:hypothetical protein
MDNKQLASITGSSRLIEETKLTGEEAKLGKAPKV